MPTLSQHKVAALKDKDCVEFLQWSLPRLGMRWRGFRRVRRQLCRRLHQRLVELQLDDIARYRQLLDAAGEAAEWGRLDRLCRISISRFYRDKGVFQRLERELLSRLQQQIVADDGRPLRIWSIGCASGEEAYSMALMCAFNPALSRRQVDIVATDADPHLLARARRACYPASSLRELPQTWRGAFDIRNNEFCLQSKYRAAVCFAEQDIRQRSAEGRFDLILCRNLVFTYFVPALQMTLARRLAQALAAGGLLLLGSHETLPDTLPGLEAETAWLYRRIDLSARAHDVAR